MRPPLDQVLLTLKDRMDPMSFGILWRARDELFALRTENAELKSLLRDSDQTDPPVSEGPMGRIGTDNGEPGYLRLKDSDHGA